MNIKFFQAKIQTNASAKLDIMKIKINFAKNVIIPGFLVIFLQLFLLVPRIHIKVVWEQMQKIA